MYGNANAESALMRITPKKHSIAGISTYATALDLVSRALYCYSHAKMFLLLWKPLQNEWHVLFFGWSKNMRFSVASSVYTQCTPWPSLDVSWALETSPAGWIWLVLWSASWTSWCRRAASPWRCRPRRCWPGHTLSTAWGGERTCVQPWLSSTTYWFYYLRGTSLLFSLVKFDGVIATEKVKRKPNTWTTDLDVIQKIPQKTDNL